MPAGHVMCPKHTLLWFIFVLLKKKLQFLACVIKILTIFAAQIGVHYVQRAAFAPYACREITN